MGVNGHSPACSQPFALEEERMPKSCNERERLLAAYWKASVETANAGDVLPLSSASPELIAALNKAEVAQQACEAARRAYQHHCTEHGCVT